MNDMTAGPQLRPVHECTFRTHDGVDLFYRHWPAIHGPARGAIVLFPSRPRTLGADGAPRRRAGPAGVRFLRVGRRGHGRSPGARGDSPSFGTSVRDVQSFVDHIAAGTASPSRTSASSRRASARCRSRRGSTTTRRRSAAWSSRRPAFRVKLYVPFALPALALMRRLAGNFFVTSYVKAKFLTHDPARIASYETDPLLSRAISVNVLLGLQAAADRVVADAQAITVPTQLLVSGADWVVRHGPQHEFFDRLGAREKERHVLHGFLHDTLGERDREPRARSRARIPGSQYSPRRGHA